MPGVTVEDAELGESGSGWTVRLGLDVLDPAPETLWLTTLKPCEVEAWFLPEAPVVIGCAKGTVEAAFHRDGETASLYMGERTPRRVEVEPGVHYGYRNIGKDDAVVAVVSGSREERRETALEPDAEEIGYAWFSRATERLI